MMLSRQIPSHVLDQWIGGHYAAITDLPKQARLHPLIAESLDASMVAEWCSSHRPDVVVSNEIAIPGWLKGMRHSSGRPIAFASLDRHASEVETAGIDQLHEIIGSAAVDLIVAQVNRNERGVPRYPKDVLIEGEWVHGSSAPPV